MLSGCICCLACGASCQSSDASCRASLKECDVVVAGTLRSQPQTTWSGCPRWRWPWGTGRTPTATTGAKPCPVCLHACVLASQHTQAAPCPCRHRDTAFLKDITTKELQDLADCLCWPLEGVRQLCTMLCQAEDQLHEYLLPGLQQKLEDMLQEDGPRRRSSTRVLALIVKATRLMLRDFPLKLHAEHGWGEAYKPRVQALAPGLLQHPSWVAYSSGVELLYREIAGMRDAVQITLDNPLSLAGLQQRRQQRLQANMATSAAAAAAAAPPSERAATPPSSPSPGPPTPPTVEVLAAVSPQQQQQLHELLLPADAEEPARKARRQVLEQTTARMASGARELALFEPPPAAEPARLPELKWSMPFLWESIIRVEQVRCCRCRKHICTLHPARLWPKRARRGLDGPSPSAGQDGACCDEQCYARPEQ